MFQVNLLCLLLRLTITVEVSQDIVLCKVVVEKLVMCFFSLWYILRYLFLTGLKLHKVKENVILWCNY